MCKKNKKLIKNRIPVSYLKRPLMPISFYRAQKLVNKGKAKIKWFKHNFMYLELLKEPSGYNTQDCTLGIDFGTMFNGYSIVTKNNHLLNIQRNTLKTKYIQKHNEERVEFRRQRRSRLRHRKLRIDNRIGHKTSKTHHYLWSSRIQIIKDLMKFYPINVIVVEDVKFDHFHDKIGLGKSFSNVEVGKNYFRRWVKSLNLKEYIERDRLDTKELRLKYFKGVDKKSKDRGIESFYSHCFDGFVLANSYFNNNYKKIKETTVFLNEQIAYKSSNRSLGFRVLRDFTGRYSESYFRYGKGNKKIYFDKFHKSKTVRVKPENQKSNHGPWEYKLSFEPKSCKIERRRFSYSKKGISKSKEKFKKLMNKDNLNYYPYLYSKVI